MPPSLVPMLTVCLGFLVLASAAPGQGVLINEVHTGDPDYVEIANFGQTAVDLSNWTLRTSFGYLIYPQYTLPQGTILPPGGIAVAIEHAGGMGPPLPPVPLTAVSLATGFGWGWVGTSSGSAVLADAAGAAVDVVVFGTAIVTVPPPGPSQPFANPVDRTNNDPSIDDAVYRTTSVDSNGGADWVNGPDSEATPGSLNPGQVTTALDVQRLVLDETSSSLAITNDQLALTATIVEIVTSGGQSIVSPTIDPLVGGTVTATGNRLAGDQVTLAGVLFAPATTVLTTNDGGDVLTLTGILISFGDEWTLAGPAGAQPTPVTKLSSQVINGVTRTTTGSAALDGLATSLDDSPFTFLVRRETQALVPTRLEVSYAPGAPALEAAIAERDPGQLEVGVIGGNGGELWSFFAPNPTTPFGAGPLFGMELGPIQIAIALTPLGTHPFHVLPDQHGNYHLLTPPALIPGGLVLDYLAVEVLSGVARHTQLMRVTF